VIDGQVSLRNRASQIALERVRSIAGEKDRRRWLEGKRGIREGLHGLFANSDLGDYKKAGKKVDRIVARAACRILKDAIHAYWFRTNPTREVVRIGEFVKNCIPLERDVVGTEYLSLTTSEVWEFVDSKESLEEIRTLYNSMEKCGKDPAQEFKEMIRINLSKLKGRSDSSLKGRPFREAANLLLDETISQCYNIVQGAGVSKKPTSSKRWTPYHVVLSYFAKYFSEEYPVRGIHFFIHGRRRYRSSLGKLRLRHRRHKNAQLA
jgi:hypothetical protein